MSRSNPNDEIINPCKNWFQWDGGDGQGFKQYIKEEKKNVIYPLPFKFLVLDRLNTVVGFNEPRNLGYWSNEVRNIKDKLTVRSKDGIEAEGTWEEVKSKIGTDGANFAQSVYILFYKDKQPTLGNIKMSGAALENWFDFCKENKVNEIGIQVKTVNKKKKGKVEYFEPVFEPMKITEATNNFAIEMDKELQMYLTAYLQRNATTIEQSKTDEKAPETAQNTAKTTASNDTVTDVAFTDVNDNDDLPF